MTNVLVTLVRPLLDMWRRNAVILAQPGSGNDQAVPVSGAHPLPVEARMMVFRGGTWVPWDGAGSGSTPDPLPTPVINNVVYDDGGQNLIVVLAAPVPGADIQVLAAAGFVMTSATAGADAQVVIPLLPQPGQTVTVRVVNGGSEAVWPYTFQNAPTLPVIQSVTYDESTGQLVVTTVAVAPAGYQLLIRGPSGAPLMVYSLGQPRLEHRFPLPALPGETITIDLFQGDGVLSTTPFTFPSAPGSTSWGIINGITWSSVGPWYNDQGWWATAGSAVLTGTGFTPGGGAALEFEMTSGLVEVQWQNEGGEIISGAQVQPGSHQFPIPDGAARVLIISFDPAQYGPIWIPGFSIFLPAS